MESVVSRAVWISGQARQARHGRLGYSYAGMCVAVLDAFAKRQSGRRSHVLAWVPHVHNPPYATFSFLLRELERCVRVVVLCFREVCWGLDEAFEILQPQHRGGQTPWGMSQHGKCSLAAY